LDEKVSAVASPQAPALACSELDVVVADRLLVRRLSLTIERGTVTCILGCNGAGKTLTLHTLAGIRDLTAGQISIGERSLRNWPRKALARELGLLTQTTDDPFPSSVLETVLIGRHPHIDFWQWESEEDKDISRAALATVGLGELQARDIATLSGGERRRVAIAALLAQDPKLMLLDEPINHLDPHHQIEVLRLMRARAASGRTVIMSLHDAGLATRFADYALLLFGNGDWQFGAVNDTLNEDSISRLYGMRVQEVKWPGGRLFAPKD
jgi:iron complex transport system ATP-binding protein